MKIVITVEVPDGAAVAVGTEEPVKALPKAKQPKAAPAPEPAAPAPAAVAAPPAPAPAPEPAPTVTIAAVNAKVSALAGLDGGHTIARQILVAHGANAAKTSTSQLKPEVYQVVIDETEEAIDKINAAATQIASSDALV
jgi:hypothetical protein